MMILCSSQLLFYSTPTTGRLAKGEGVCVKRAKSFVRKRTAPFYRRSLCVCGSARKKKTGTDPPTFLKESAQRWPAQKAISKGKKRLAKEQVSENGKYWKLKEKYLDQE